jgi:hypothetical protein
MSWSREMLRAGPAWATAVLVTTVMGSMIQSWQVQSGLTMAMLSDVAVEAALREFTGLAVPVLTIFGLTLVLAVAATSWLKPRVPLLAPIAWPLAGAAAVGTTLGFIHARLQVAPLAGDRALDGFVLLCSAGAIGGVLFAWLKPRPRR